MKRSAESAVTTEVASAYRDVLSDIGKRAAALVVEIGREQDGRWYALVPDMPGVMAYGETVEEAERAAKALALEVAADCLRHGEPIPEPLDRIFQTR